MGLFRPSEKHQDLKTRWKAGTAGPLHGGTQPRSCGSSVRHLFGVRSELVLTWHLPPLPLPRHAWGEEAARNMPVAALAGTLLLASVFFTLSAACALTCKGGNCNRAAGWWSGEFF